MDPVLIVGMLRSGTSMVAHVLHAAGLRLGPAEALLPADANNLDGYWEHREVVRLHDDLLARLNASWEEPPEVQPGWHERLGMGDLHDRAGRLLAELTEEGPAGWKDPRGSLLLPFWLELAPTARIVLCVRNPLEVAGSLWRRSSMSKRFSLRLWERYNAAALGDAPEDRLVVTHYDSWLVDPGAELDRVARQLGLDLSTENRDAAAAVTNPGLRHHVVPDELQPVQQTPPRVLGLYARLSTLAGIKPSSSLLMGASLAETEAELRRTQDALEQAADLAERAHREGSELRAALESAREEIRAGEVRETQLRLRLAEREASLEVFRAAIAERDHAGERLREELRADVRGAVEEAWTTAERSQVIQRGSEAAVAGSRLLPGPGRPDWGSGLISPSRTPADGPRSHPSARDGGDRLSTAVEEKRRRRRHYDDVKSGLREVVEAVVPPGATVAVTSRGDDQLLRFAGRTAWHFPCLEDGSYAGFYPKDDAAAIAHLEEVRSRGAEYLVFPETSAWWLEHYEGLARHLSDRYALLARVHACVVFGLTPTEPGREGKRLEETDVDGGTTGQAYRDEVNGAPRSLADASGQSTGRPAVGNGLRLAGPTWGRDVPDELLVAESGLFDEAFYRAAYLLPSTEQSPVEHFCRIGWRAGHQPNPYFDTAWYVRAYGNVMTDPNPVLDYIAEEGARRPGPLFDPTFYAETYRDGDVVGTLADYLAHVNRGEWRNPVDMFDVHFYLSEYPDVREAGADPVQHYLHQGHAEGRNPSRSFETTYYRSKHLDGDVQINPLVHYYETGRAAGLSTHFRLDDDHGHVHGEVRRWVEPGPEFETFDSSIAGDRPRRVKAIAFYLPQFHAIPENDQWWGEGFTEWRNVARGMPRFLGHYQPRIPRDLGFYDLTDGDTMRRQVELARAAGLHGFAFYYYWFNGKRLLDAPLDRFLADKSLDFNFSLVWANENWTRRWDGHDHEVLLQQDYDAEFDLPLVDDLQRYFEDPRYIRIDGRPLLTIYRMDVIPGGAETLDRWRSLWWSRHGEKPLIFIAQTFGTVDPRPYGADGAAEFPPHKLTGNGPALNGQLDILDPAFRGWVFDYADVVAESVEDAYPDYPLIKTVVPSWDNDARRQGAGTVLHGSTPDLYERWLRALVQTAEEHPVFGEPILFINAWNEWAEGAYLEPDVHFGSAYLNATARAVCGTPQGQRPTSSSGPKPRKVLLIGHDGHPFGAQINLWHMGDVLRHQFGCEVSTVLLDGGPMVEQYECLGRTIVASDPSDWDEVVTELHRDGYHHALVNSVASGNIIPRLKSAGFCIVSLVHELPGIIEEYGLADALDHMMRHSDRVVVPSEVVASGLQQLAAGGRANVVVRPQGLYRRPESSDTARMRVRTELGISADAVVVLNLGSADLRKGVDTFLHVAKATVQRSPQTHFVWVGKRNENVTRWLEKDLVDELSGHLHFIDFTEDVSGYYSAADVFFLSSREDPFPSVVLEALHAGLPVVAFSGATGMEALIAEHGRLVPGFDVEGTIRALSECGAEQDAVARAARQATLEEQFRFDDYCFDLLRLLDPKLQKVSVVVPNYNYRQYLSARLQSVFDQTYPVFEVLVLDDCSQDGSLEELARIRQTTGRRLEVVPNQANSGSTFLQWRTGCRMARGDVVWLAEADDLSYPEFLERLVGRLVSADADYAFCDSESIDESGSLLGRSYKEYYRQAAGTLLDDDFVLDGDEFVRKCLVERNLILNVSSVVWRRAHLLETVDSSIDDLRAYQLAGDWHLYVAAALGGGRVAYVAEPLNVHRRHQGSVTGSLQRRRHVDEVRLMHDAIRRRLTVSDGVSCRMSAYVGELRTMFGLTDDAETTGVASERRRQDAGSGRRG